jgi:diacylglycerol kinase family enzyme
MVAAALVGRLHLVEKFESIFDTELSVDARRPLRVSLDGEVRVLRTPLRYRIRPRALRVLVPRVPAATS